MTRRLPLLSFAGALAFASNLLAAEDPWAPWIEPNYPFFSSSLDLRGVAPGGTPQNITPRGIVLNLGHGCWACFDTELLRVAAIWQGGAVSTEALAQLSYQNGNIKTVGGQTKLPKPKGPVWLYNGMYPGWQSGDRLTLTDSREPQPTAEESGRGPIPSTTGQFKAVHLNGAEAVLEYVVAGSSVREWITAGKHDGAPSVQRNFQITPAKQTLTLVLGSKTPSQKGVSASVLLTSEQGDAALLDHNDVWAVRIPAGTQNIAFSVTISPDSATPPTSIPRLPPFDIPSVHRWTGEVKTQATLSTSKEAYVVDDIALPLENPWRRNIRLADIGFFSDGTAATVTLDGDVWIVRGLKEKLGTVHWQRFASGLHEPMSLAIRDDELYVFDRNGIWRLRDTDNDGEADVHELFSNVFPQSAESREFANSLKVAPDGAFIIAKGGQQASTISKYNGSVLRVARDGQTYLPLGVGFRQPFAGVNPRTGLVTASDQEGNYTPTTPLYIVKDAEFHGFLSEILPREQYPAPIADPLTWIPHPVNASAASQVWLYDAKMGPLNDNLIHVGFNRPELFRVMLNEREKKPQAAIVSIVRDFDVPSLNAAVNPADGWLYTTGFQVIGWGTTAKRVSGLARVRYTGAPMTLPKEVVPMDQGVLLRFEVALDPKKATDFASYSLESWGYRRTYQYGSPHLKADGKPGQDWVAPSSAYLSKDGKSVFVGVPGMKPVMQMRIGWALQTATGLPVEENAYFTPYELTKFNPEAEGFGPLTVDLTPKASVASADAKPTIEEGIRIYKMMGCMACHATDDTVQQRIGPPWKGLYGKQREFAKAPSCVADEEYLRESIMTPAARIVKGYEKTESGMPVYAGVLTDSQIDSVILFIKSLK